MPAERPQHYTLVFQFVAALLHCILDCPTVEAQQQALQRFFDDLVPWISRADLPPLRRQPFPLFDHLAVVPHSEGPDEDVRVALSAEGQAVFRAWLRQRGLDPFLCSS
jgi:hypothetical protein